MQRSPMLACLLAALMCYTHIAHAAGDKKPHLLAKDVVGVQLDDSGQYYVITEHDGVTWIVVDNEEQGMPFFVNHGTREAQWEDPRRAIVFKDGKLYGPQISSEPSPPPPPSTVEEPLPTMSIVAVATVPVCLFIAGLVGRIYYLQQKEIRASHQGATGEVYSALYANVCTFVDCKKYHPELLWPTKSRKHRYRMNNKMKATKHRGKMSQDGKGGRSANS